jgi:hypothetical protein
MSSDDDIQEYEQSNNYIIIDENYDTSILIKMDYRTLIKSHCIKQWAFNRQLSDNVINELYESITTNNNIKWTLTAFKERDSENLYLIDGQHRYEAIKRKINEDIEMEYINNIYIIIYLIDNKELEVNYIIDLFNKINNNTPLNNIDYPDNTIINMVEKIIKDPILKNGIKKNERHHSSHQPFIHKKTLNELLQNNKESIIDMNIDDIIRNLKIINNRLSLMRFDEIYDKKTDANYKSWCKANNIQFILGLRDCKNNYKIENIIKNIRNPELVFQ